MVHQAPSSHLCPPPVHLPDIARILIHKNQLDCLSPRPLRSRNPHFFLQRPTWCGPANLPTSSPSLIPSLTHSLHSLNSLGSFLFRGLGIYYMFCLESFTPAWALLNLHSLQDCPFSFFRNLTSSERIALTYISKPICTPALLLKFSS